MFRIIRLAIVLFAGLGLVGLFMLTLPTSAARDAPPNTNIVVDTLDDELNSDGYCSLREAIMSANDNIPVDTCPSGDAVLTDTITFSVAGTITLTEQVSVTTGGPVVIDGGEVITISGNNSVRVFLVNSGSNLVVKNMIFTDGYSWGGAGVTNNGTLKVINSEFINNFVPGFLCEADGHGGGIYNSGTGKLYVIESTFSLNHSEDGGGIYNQGQAWVVDSYFYENSADCGGSGIFNSLGGVIYIYNTLVSGNGDRSISNHEGFITIENCAILNNTGIGVDNAGGGALNILNSTISDNTYMGISNIWAGSTMISNSTISGNTGGIYSQATTMNIINSTITANSNAGISNWEYNSTSALTNTIVSDNGLNCSGIIIDGGSNIDSENTCGFDPANGSMINTNPLLGPLQDNGGSNWTHALLSDSPAIDAADPAYCPPTDQRGIPRPFDGDGDGVAICDIGSYELAYWITLTPAIQSSSAAPGTTIEYTIELFNFTNMTDTYTLTLGSHSWDISFSMEMIGPIPSWESQPFTVSVSIPVTATWYMTDTVTVSATSVTRPMVYSTTALVTTQAYAPPQISVSPTVLTSTQYINQIVTLPLTISNGLGVTLTYSITPSEAMPWLSIEPISGTVFTNETSQVLATLHATGLPPDIYTATLEIESNDPASPSLLVPVTMTLQEELTMFQRVYLPIVHQAGIGDWIKYSEPVLEPGPIGTWDHYYVICPEVFFDGTQYRMWYSGGNVYPAADEIGYATSMDGINWEKYQGNPVLKTGETGDWDDAYVREPVLINDGSTWKMWYEGVNEITGSHQIGYATSEDGISWIKHEGNPVLITGSPGSWDEHGVGGPYVLFNRGEYHMWYYNRGSIGNIGYATSNDGVIWTKFSGNPILTPPIIGVVYNGLKSPTVVEVFGEYNMWIEYSMADRADYSENSIIHKTSQDGVNWATGGEDLPHEFLQHHFCPSVILHNDTVKMWYSKDQKIFYAEAPLIP